MYFPLIKTKRFICSLLAVFFITQGGLFGQNFSARDYEDIKKKALEVLAFPQKITKGDQGIDPNNHPSIPQKGSLGFMQQKGDDATPLVNEISPFSDTVPSCADTSRKQLYSMESRQQYVADAIRLKDGNLVISGISFVKDPLTNSGSYYPYLLKLSGSGQVIWNYQWFTKDLRNLYITHLFEMADGSILGTGEIYNADNPIMQEYVPDALVIKFSNAGNYIWSRTFYRRKPRCNQYVSVDLKFFHEFNDGTMLLGGNIYSCPTPFVPVIMKLNASGELLWDKAIGTGHYENSLLSLFMGQMLVNEDKVDMILWDDEKLFKAETPLSPLPDLSVKAVRCIPPDNSFPYNFNYLLAYDLSAVQLPNGNYRIASRTLASAANDRFDTFSLVGILDLSIDFEPLSYVLPSSTIKTNGFNHGYYNFIYLRKDGSYDLGYMDFLGPLSIDYYVANMGNQHQTLKQRRLTYRGVETIANIRFVPGESGNYNIIMDNINNDIHFLENNSLHFSDTASACMGNDTSFIIWQQDRYVPFTPEETWPVFVSTFVETPHIVNAFGPLKTDLFDGCNQVSYCDSLSIMPTPEKICRPGETFSLEASVNNNCGLWVQWHTSNEEGISLQSVGQKQAAINFSGTYDGWVFATITGNCGQLKDSVRFTVADLPEPFTLGPDTVVCAGSPIVLRATPGYFEYQWNTGQSGDTLEVKLPGTYSATAKDACGQTVSHSVEVLPYQPPYFSAGEALGICPGTKTVLQATPGFSNYQWSPDSNLLQPALPNPTATPLTTTTYHVTAEARPGCRVHDSVTITVFQGAPFSLGNDFSICNGESKRLQGPEGFAAYRWNTGDTTKEVWVNKAGAYILEATSFDGCPQSDTIRLLSVHPLPVVRLARDSVICEGATVTYSPGTFSSYLWQDGSTAPTFTATQPGTYWVQVADANVCTGGDTTIIARMQPLPSLFLPADSTICNYDTWDLRPLRPFATYLWNSGATTPSIQVNRAGNYHLQVTDIYGCKGEDDINVDVQSCLEGLFAPNAFTPNNDGKNDVFRVALFGNIVSYQLRIYNRFGQMLFYANHPSVGWPGTYQGIPQPSGTYIWKCTYQLLGSAEKEDKGSFTLIR